MPAHTTDSTPQRPDGTDLADAGDPADADDLTDASGTVKASAPAGAGEPTDSDGPADAGDLTDVNGTVKASAPADAGEPTDSDAPADAGEPTDSDAPADAGEPTDSDDPADAGEPTDSDDPADAGDLTDVNGTVKASAPADAGDATDAGYAVSGPGSTGGSEATAVHAGPPPPGPGGGVGGGGVDAARRVAVLRRAADGGRRWRGPRLAGCAALLAVALTGGVIALGGARDGRTEAAAVSAAGALSPGDLARGDLGTAIGSLQRHLRAQPKDFGSWATLGLAYVEQARTGGDPSRYPQADRALRRSLALRPGNDQALAGRAALAAARHDFTGALTHADRALERNPYNERALCTRVDALVELGRYDDAAEAARTADDRRPGVPVFTRYAYVHELRGDVRTAREVLHRALDSARSPADVAYVATALGQLAWNQGEYEEALAHYARALAADDAYLPALEGRARAQAANGDRAAAVQGLERVVARSPLPGPLVALGELYEDRGADGDRAKAGDQYALVDAWTALARAGGVNADLDTAMAAADHGDKEQALRAARAEWDRRHSVHTADALAWALHVNGRDEEALPYARRATATGYRNAAFLHHLGVIEYATGDRRAARTHLRAALELNPGFSPLGAREARAALEDLEGNR
ncbi:tetratricopeptide repeat protein [Streptomyces sp. AHA2]|uniref:tetratricopeptide repeat protein n=1 Tax=Streptomyces sp. AHA2 TaxID=3064526 RepID=UPI002FDF4AEC